MFTLRDLDVVELLHGFNLGFLRAQSHQEDKGVVVLDLLHGGLGCERVFYHREVIQSEEGFKGRT